MHNRNLAHNDIKPENLLLSFSTIKLSDFGWSCTSRGGRREKLCDYLPPEAYLPDEVLI